MVQTYTPYMSEVTCGDYVLKSDYDALAAELEEAIANFADPSDKRRIRALESALREIKSLTEPRHCDDWTDAVRNAYYVAQAILATSETACVRKPIRVGCETADGTIIVHGEDETCEVCSALNRGGVK
jgi:hypothetical protein